MGTKIKLLATIGAAGVLGVGGVGIAQALGEEPDDIQMTGPDAEKAKAAALKAVGTGRVASVETENEPGSAWEVEIVRPDGTEIEATLDSAYRSVGVERDDDGPGDDKSDDDGPGDDDSGDDD
jgi:hypothetical protein